METPMTDPAVASGRIVAAELARDRLRNVLPRLKEKLATMRHSEACAAWRSELESMTAARDRINEKLSYQRYVDLAKQIVAMLRQAAELNAMVDEVNGRRPASEVGMVHHLDLEATWIKDVELPGVFSAEAERQRSRNLAAVATAQVSYPSHTRGTSMYIGPGWETPELQRRFAEEKAAVAQDVA
jgi:hypothetical protein